MANETKLVGMAGLYDDVNALMGAAVKVRDSGYRRWDCHTPYPVHGLDGAMGLKASPLPYICITCGLIGACLGMLMQGWMNAQDYTINIGGKAFFGWPAFVPITFEVFVLCASLSITGSLIFFCRLWRWHSPLYDAGVMGEVTRDRFAVVLEANDKRFNETEARALLEETGCQDIRPLYEDANEESVFS